MNIERTIGIKAAGLYLLTGILVILTGVYLYRSGEEVKNQREALQYQQELFSLTNEFIQLVNDIQLSGSQFIASNEPGYIIQIDKRIPRIDSIIAVLSDKHFPEIDELNQIRELVQDQLVNFNKLDKLFRNENPVAHLQKSLMEYNVPSENSVNIVTIKQDTIVRTTKRKKFFQRLKDVFAPGEDSAIVVSHERIDTLKINGQDSQQLVAEMENLTLSASRLYEENLREIEMQLAALISADRRIAARLSGLLSGLNKKTLTSILEAIDRREAVVNETYTLAITGGIGALLLILLFILLIINDVNKGKQTRERLREVMESRHQLLLSVAHDIKSPLNSIIAYLELKAGESHETKSMQQAAGHIMAMLENLLEFSSLEQGKLQLTLSETDISTLGKDMKDMFAPLAKAKGLDLTVIASQGIVRADELKLKQILINLLSNSIKYTPSGSVYAEISYEGNYLKIGVKDTGAGIPATELATIFKPFTRVENNNKLAHGSGFGMFVVKGLIDLMGGIIHLESEVNRGTHIEITIPLQLSESRPLAGKTRKIAVYEDDTLMFQLVCEMLTTLGHEVVEQGYDCILTDMEMGNKTGLDILEQEKEVPVYLMSGRSDMTEQKAHRLGFAGFIPKPFTIKQLRKRFGVGSTNQKEAETSEHPEMEIASSNESSFWEDIDEEIIAVFRRSTLEHQEMLQKALQENDFVRSQAICHKMLPMFAQLGYPTEALKRMDASRGKAYENWQNDIRQLLSFTI